MLSLVAQFDLELEQIDVKTAFRRGELEERIYIEQPEGFEVHKGKNMVCFLKKSLYRLKQFPSSGMKGLHLHGQTKIVREADMILVCIIGGIVVWKQNIYCYM